MQACKNSELEKPDERSDASKLMFNCDKSSFYSILVSTLLNDSEKDGQILWKKIWVFDIEKNSNFEKMDFAVTCLNLEVTITRILWIICLTILLITVSIFRLFSTVLFEIKKVFPTRLCQLTVMYRLSQMWINDEVRNTKIQS